MSKNKPIKRRRNQQPDEELTVYVSVTLAVGLAYTRGKRPGLEEMKCDALDNFLSHPLMSSSHPIVDLIPNTKIEIEPSARESKRRKAILSLADDRLGRDGELEFDLDAKIAEGEDNGCYVLGWSWLDFAGTKFDKEKTT